MLINEIVARRAVRTVFQPIVDLDGGQVVAYEALSRGPEGPLERPDLMFAAARDEGLLADLDMLCRETALRTAVDLDWPGGAALFVNVEPQVLDVKPLDELIELAATAPGELQVVLEITERAVSARPAELLSSVRKLRQAGWRIALDDVGADDMSLAFMPLLQPDVVKLDLKLVQERPGPAVAQIMNAVNAYAQRTGAVLLAEGIETEQHLEIARALGARLGQGWMFGRPASTVSSSLPTGTLDLARPHASHPAVSPFGCLPSATPLRRSTKPLLVELSKHLEAEALAHGATCVVISTFQFQHHFTPRTAQRYESLAERLGFVAAIGHGLSPNPAPGVRGATLHDDDPLRDEWDIVVLAPHFCAALLARDLGDDAPDAERRFEFALTYDRAVVSAAAEALLSRVSPIDAVNQAGTAAGTATGVTERRNASIRAVLPRGAELATTHNAESVKMLHRALAATSNGVTIADMTRPDHPLIYVNAAFERLSGLPRDLILRQNCRLLQGPETDPSAVARIRAALASGQECRETVLNYRHGSNVPWWNEIYLAPIRDDAGRVVQYIGVQNDVTDRVTAERQLAAEKARYRALLAETEMLANKDPLTGLLNRRRLPDMIDQILSEAATDDSAVAFLYVDVDGFKSVNDQFGHARGDIVLRRIGEQLQVAAGTLKARLGGDEFLIVLPGLDRRSSNMDSIRAARQLHNSLHCDIGGHPVTVSIGTSVFPDDGADFDALLHAADRRMYEAKHKPHPRPLPAGPRLTVQADSV